MKYWAILLVSAGLEAVWANALSASDGFAKPVPTLVFLVAAACSQCGLAIAMRRIPTGTAYAVWTSIGTVLTVAYSAAMGTEPLGVVKVLLLAGIVGLVVGLKLLDTPSQEPKHAEA